MARFKPRSPDDLFILRAGMCPDCGASVFAGMTACKACGLEFPDHQHELPAAKPRAAAPAAAPKPTAPAAPPPAAAAGPLPTPQVPPPAPAQARAGAPPPVVPPPASPANRGKPLTLEDIEELERGPLRANLLPLTEAEGPDVAGGMREPWLGAALQRAATVVMADAAVDDDPLVLLGYPKVDNHLPRAKVNLRRSDAAAVDDPENLAIPGPPRSSASPELAPSGSTRAPSAPSGGTPSRAGAGSGGAPRGPGPGVGQPLTLEDVERLERPVVLSQPHSFAELPETEQADPRLGIALIRGANVVMADAAVVDDPLVLLGYPPIHNHIPRAAFHLRRSDAAAADDVATLLQRPAPAPATTAPSTAPAAPPSGAASSGASGGPRAAPPRPSTTQISTPAVSPSPAGRAPAARPATPSAGPNRRAPDPDATALLDQAAVRAAMEAVAREQRPGPPGPPAAPAPSNNPNRKSQTSVSVRGGVRPLDD